MACNSYLTVSDIPGNCGDVGYEEFCRVLEFEDENCFQVDPKQAIKTGALNIKPTRAICQIDQAYPLLLKAMRQSTNLTISVVHTDTDADGAKVITDEDNYEDVIIVGLKKYMPNTSDPSNEQRVKEMEISWTSGIFTSKQNSFKAANGVEAGAKEDTLITKDPQAS